MVMVPRFWLTFGLGYVGGPLHHVGAYRIGFRTQPLTSRTHVEVDEATYRLYYAKAFAYWARSGETPPSPDDYWDLPFDFHVSVFRGGPCSLSGCVRDKDGHRMDDADVRQFLLADPRSITNPPTWDDLAVAHSTPLNNKEQQ